MRLKPPLVVRNPPSRVRILVREGGLCNMSDDFNRAAADCPPYKTKTTFNNLKIVLLFLYPVTLSA